MVAKLKASRKEIPLSSRILGGFFLLLIWGVAAALIAQNARMIQKRTELTKTVANLERQVAQLQVREIELEATVAENQGEDFQEKILRERGLYQKPGEQVITILPAQEEDSDEEKREERAWWNPLTW